MEVINKKIPAYTIEMQHISKSFGYNTVLQDFNLQIEKGHSLGILGISGSGKSVCLKCILGLIEPDHGEVLINGLNMNNLSYKQRQSHIGQIGMLFQNAALFDSLSIWQNVAFRLIEGMGIDQTIARRIAIDKLAMVGMDESVAELLPAELSGGMRKRVGLARAIASDPKILFFDEPTAGLDPIMGRIIDKLIVSCIREVSATALTITHDIESLRHITDQVVMLHQGKDIWKGSTREIDSTDNPYVRQFVSGLDQGPIGMPILHSYPM